MTDESTRDRFAQLSNQSRRRILKAIGLGATSFGIGSAEATTGPANSEDPGDYDRRMYPGERAIGYNIALTNNTAGVRTVSLQIQRQTSGKTNPIIFEQSYRIPGPDDGDTFPNVLRKSNHLSFGKPGYFLASVETDRGRSAEYEFRQPTGEVRPNELISVRLMDEELRLTYQRA